MDDAITELEGMRKAAEADEAASVALRKRLIGLQDTFRKTRQVSTFDALVMMTLPHANMQPGAVALVSVHHQ